MKRLYAAVFAAALALSGCSLVIDPNSVPPPKADAGAASTDGGGGDGGNVADGGWDAGATDAGTTDGGTTDAGATDGGTTDGGTTDGGGPDAGVFNGTATLRVYQVTAGSALDVSNGTQKLSAGVVSSPASVTNSTTRLETGKTFR